MAATKSLTTRLAAYVARVGIVAAGPSLGVSRHTIERALGGLRMQPGVAHLILAGLDADDAARSASAEGQLK